MRTKFWTNLITISFLPCASFTSQGIHGAHQSCVEFAMKLYHSLPFLIIFFLGMNITGTQFNNIVPLTQDCWSQHIVRILGLLSTFKSIVFNSTLIFDEKFHHWQNINHQKLTKINRQLSHFVIHQSERVSHKLESICGWGVDTQAGGRTPCMIQTCFIRHSYPGQVLFTIFWTTFASCGSGYALNEIFRWYIIP